MKKSIGILAALFLMMTALWISAGAAGQTVVYLKDGVSGDGASADTAVNSLTKAFDLLDLSKDCTVVICGPFLQSEDFNYTSDYTGSVTFTSVYNGVDYRSGKQAAFSFTDVRFVCRGDTRFEHINLAAWQNYWFLIGCHNPITIGEGVSVSGDGLKGGKLANSITILGGYQKDVNEPPTEDNSDVNITVLSGRMIYIVPYNRGLVGTYTGTANIHIGGNAEIATLHGSSATDDSVLGDVRVTLTDEAVIHTFYGGTMNNTEKSFTLQWKSGSIENFYWDCPYTPTKHITFTNGTTLLASETAQGAENFAAIAKLFDTVRSESGAALEVTLPPETDATTEASAPTETSAPEETSAVSETTESSVTAESSETEPPATTEATEVTESAESPEASAASVTTEATDAPASAEGNGALVWGIVIAAAGVVAVALIVIFLMKKKKNQ